MPTNHEAEGELFRKARDVLGLTQSQVAEKAGTDQSTISRLERGDQKGISPSRLNAIRLAVELPLPELGPDPKALELACCTSPRCLSHTAIDGDELYLLPHFVKIKSDSTAYCRYCPAALDTACSGCGEPVVNSIRCPHCQTAYVHIYSDFKQPGWAREHNQTLRETLEQMRMLNEMDTEDVYEVVSKKQTSNHAEPVSANQNEGVRSEREINFPAGRPE